MDTGAGVPQAKWRAHARGAWLLALEVVFPQFCKGCGERLFDLENGFFCPGCWEAPARVAAPYCTECGKPHAGMIGFGMPQNYPCAACREKPNKHIGAIRGAVEYGGAIETAIKLLKFHGKIRLAPPLAGLMRAFAVANLDTASYTHLVPVPLHRVRERERGFNQSALLAREALPAFPRAVYDEQLQRIRPTLTQSRLRGAARHGNVRGAFAYVGPSIKGARVLLVDDVVTTAGTVTECARILKIAGAESVDVLAVALAMPGAGQ
jgi:ComF family protein